MPPTQRRLTPPEAADTNYLDALDRDTRRELIQRHAECWHSNSPGHATLNECAADILATRQRAAARTNRTDARA